MLLKDLTLVRPSSHQDLGQCMSTRLMSNAIDKIVRRYDRVQARCIEKDNTKDGKRESSCKVIYSCINMNNWVNSLPVTRSSVGVQEGVAKRAEHGVAGGAVLTHMAARPAQLHHYARFGLLNILGVLRRDVAQCGDELKLVHVLGVVLGDRVRRPRTKVLPSMTILCTPLASARVEADQEYPVVTGEEYDDMPTWKDRVW
jgi:hypothetical protein